MRLDIYENFNLANIITSFNSLKTNLKFRGIGNFKLEANDKNIFNDAVCGQQYIKIGKEWFIIENRDKIDERDNIKYTLSGRHINCILERRVTDGFVINAGENIVAVAEKMIKDNFINPKIVNRKADNFILKKSNLVFNAKENIEIEAGNLDKIMDKLMMIANLGWHIDYDLQNKKYVFEIKQGKDLSNIVIFGDKFNNISEVHIFEETNEFKNVGFKKNQDSQILEEFYVTGKAGIERREVILQDNENEVDLENQYKKKFGAEFVPKISEQYAYNKDYGLGDKVRFVSNRDGIEQIQPIIEVDEFWEGTHEIELTFGDTKTTFLDKIKKKVR